MSRIKSNHTYDGDFRATAVALTEISGVFSKHVAEAFDIHVVMLYGWRI
jgi:transposase-like protein